MNNIINIGLPSKGRLKIESSIYLRNKRFILSNKKGKRELFGFIKNRPNIKVIYLHAREIIERLADNSLDIGISGYDLLMESGMNYSKKISIKKKLNFGLARLVIAVPDKWIDVQTVADLEEIAFKFKDDKNLRLRVATKYPNLTTKSLLDKGVTQFRIVNSLGATEIYPFSGSSEIITDITSTGATLKANNLRELIDGEFLKSEACLLVSKKSTKVKKNLKALINLLS